MERCETTWKWYLCLCVSLIKNSSNSTNRSDINIFYRDGDRYEGEWRNDERHGKGVMVYATPSMITDDPKYHHFSSAKVIEEKYDGDWIDGKMQGHGIYYYADGSIYTGSWLDGKMNGTGSFVYPNGNRYEGEFAVSISSSYHHHHLYTCYPICELWLILYYRMIVKKVMVSYSIVMEKNMKVIGKQI
jgi:hypothetical protein